jgi:hypothetical protein
LEVHSWINHHIKMDHGPPTFFITLSCAEYWWHDIQRLICDRFSVAGIPSPFISDDIQKNKTKIINDYTLVVQEYFQKRVKYWLETVGKNCFKIKHYWCRFEFAPSRGQVHAHLLAIASFGTMFHAINMNVADVDKPNVIAAWAKDILGMSNQLNNCANGIKSTEPTCHPCTKTFDVVVDHDKDSDDLLTFCQHHTCNDYCLRKRKTCSKAETPESKKRRVCRFGAGVEDTGNACDTPGFRYRESNVTVRDVRGFLRLELARQSNRRILQSSTYLLQSWRANCDVQILLYESDPLNPDLAELALVTDYVVSYTCKATEHATEEKQRLKAYLLLLKDDAKDITKNTLALRVMNAAMKERLISKQEASVLLSNLDLCICSEHFETISLSASYRLDNGNYSSRFYNSYATRKQFHNMSMDEYFSIMRNSGDKQYVPHYVGGKMSPIWPPTEEFARSVLVVHTPWVTKFEVNPKLILSTFFQLINSPSCPSKVKMMVEREKFRFETGALVRDRQMKEKAINYNDFTEVDYDENNDELIALVTTLPGDAAGSVDDINFDYGPMFNWNNSYLPLTQSENDMVNDWMDNHLIANQTQNAKNREKIEIPKRFDGTSYSINTCTDDQADILAHLLHFVQNSFQNDPLQRRSEPIRMTVTGVAGSGKSTLIHTITTVLRLIFGCTESVIVCAPTGNAASNVCGTTCHFATKIGRMQPLINGISNKTLLELKKTFGNTQCLIIDERSLLSSKVIARMEFNCRHSVHNGQMASKSWGNIPIVIIIGDDYQLPPVESGVFQIYNGNNNKKDCDVIQGESVFKDLALSTMTLATSKRIVQGQIEFSALMKALRAEDGTVSQDIQLSLHAKNHSCRFHHCSNTTNICIKLK